MNIFDLFHKKPKRSSAMIAKERLQIIVSHENATNSDKGFIQKLQKELLEVISKYVKIDRKQIKVQLECQGNQSVLELNVVLPKSKTTFNA